MITSFLVFGNLGNTAFGSDNTELDSRVIGATSLLVTELGDNVLGFYNSRITSRIISSPQQHLACLADSLLTDCKLKVEGTTITFPSDIDHSSALATPPPSSINSQIGIKAVNIDFSKSVAEIGIEDLPSVLTFNELSAEFWVQDGITNQKPLEPSFTLAISLIENDLSNFIFVKTSCVSKICTYTLENDEIIIPINITETSNFLEVFTKNNSQNTASLTLKTEINSGAFSIPYNSILTFILTNPTTKIKL